MSGFVIDFLVVRTKTNFIDGLALGTILMVMGVHAAVLWGVLTFLCGYVPYLGLLLAALPATFFAWLQYGLPGAIAVVVAALVLNLIIENPVFWYLASRAFEVPAVLVVLSVLVFGWLLGLVGLLFAVPLMLMLLLWSRSAKRRAGSMCSSVWTNSSSRGRPTRIPGGVAREPGAPFGPGFHRFPVPQKNRSPCRRVLRAVAVPPTRHAAFVSGRPRLLPFRHLHGVPGELPWTGTVCGLPDAEYRKKGFRNPGSAVCAVERVVLQFDRQVLEPRCRRGTGQGGRDQVCRNLGCQVVLPPGQDVLRQVPSGSSLKGSSPSGFGPHQRPRTLM